MVRIVNGDIVRDDGPAGSRPTGPGARQRRGESSPAGAGAPPAPPGRQSRFMQSTDLRGDAPQPGVHRPAQDPLSGLARALGIEGRAVTVPAISPLGLPARDVPLVYLVVLGVLTLLFGPRALLVAAVLFVVAGRMSPDAAAGGTGGSGGTAQRPAQGRPLGR